LGLALLAVLSVLLFVDSTSVAAALGIGLGVWLILGALTDLALRSGAGTVGFGNAMRRLTGLPSSVFGTTLAHAGLGVTLLGIVAVTAFETERIVVVKPGETIEISGYTLDFIRVEEVQGPNYVEDRAIFALSQDGAQRGEIVSAKRLYPARQMPTTEAGIRTLGFSQLYVSLGDPTTEGGVVVRVWWKPLVTLIWGGALVMMAGAFVSLLDRRLRVGAPARRKRLAQPAPAE